ncbi:MAG: hypothetical protein ABII06_15950 [Pseudomonadota bacterium]
MKTRVKKVRRRHKKKIWTRSNFNLYLGITIMCFLVAFILYFVIEKGSRLVEKADELSSKIPEGVPVEDLQKVLEDKAHEDGKASDEIEKLKKAYKDQMDPAEIEKLKKKYREMTKEAP